MSDTICKKDVQIKLLYGLRIKLVVFMALTNCFRKNFIDFLSFAFICYTFCSPTT